VRFSYHVPVNLYRDGVHTVDVSDLMRRLLESDGSSMKIRTALGLINQALDEVLSEQESDCDAETRWALAWFEQHQFDEGPFDDANTLANAKALSVDGLRNIGLVQSRAGRFDS